MTPTKQVCKKGTKRPREEPETSAAFQQEELIAPTHASSHLWLRFHNKSHKRRLLWVKSRHMITPGVIHHPSLDKYGIGDEIRGMLSARPLTRLLNLNKPSYWELTYEFLSTFVFRFEKSLYHKPGENAITFHLGGIERSLSIQRWALMTGLYEPEDTHDPDFDSAIHNSSQTGIQQEAFWASIGNGDYHPSTQIDIQIREPVIRLLHRYIARSINPRTNSPKVVTPGDLFFLHCVVTNTPFHVAICLANFFHKYSRKKVRPRGLFGGAIITQVAEKFGVCLEGLSEEKKVVDWDEDWMLRHEILERVEEGGGLRLRIGEEPPVRPATRVAGQASTAATEAVAAVDARIPSDHRLGYEILQETKATQATVTSLQATVRELQSTIEDMARVMGLRPGQSAPTIPEPLPAIVPTADVDPPQYGLTPGAAPTGMSIKLYKRNI